MTDHSLLRTLAEALDGLDVAMCVFDDEDRTQLWNRAFLRYFPEHAGEVHAGEPYRANLRRFYVARLAPAEMVNIDRLIDEGVARHRGQQRPFTFQHRGHWLRVSSLALPGQGRVRVWSHIPPPRLSGNEGQPDGAPLHSGAEGREIFEHVGDGVMLTGADNRITWINEHFLRLYGLDGRAAALGQPLEAVFLAAWGSVPAADAALVQAGLATLVENLRYAGAPFELPLPGGRWVRVVEQRRHDGVGFFAHVDITQLKRQQQELRLAEQRARASEALLAEKSRLLEVTLERMEQGVMMVGATGRVEVCNRRAIELLGLPPGLMASGPSFLQVLEFQWSIDEFRHTPEALLDIVRAGGILDRPHSYDRMRPDGRVLEIQSVPIAGGGVLRTFTDITERKRQEARITHLARHDSLTSLVNRDSFLEQVGTELALAQQEGDGFAVHYLDLDRFKPVNDRLGHAVGDQVLSAVAERLRRVVRDGDTVGRMGGDEFAILQKRVGDSSQALQLARRAIASIQQPIDVEGHAVQVGLSVGIAVHPGHGHSTDSLMRGADAALYAAKGAGRGCARVFGQDGGDEGAVTP
ncbi:MAG: PAS-domain containing protein [Rubrivivax sp.]|nr:PAS-domain containing protein [Rubrivivax sp.]